MGQMCTHLPPPPSTPTENSDEFLRAKLDELDSILLIESSQPKVITGRVNVISSRWVASWLSYAAQWDGPKPGPIDNVSLTTLVNGLNEPRENLKLEVR